MALLLPRKCFASGNGVISKTNLNAYLGKDGKVHHGNEQPMSPETVFENPHIASAYLGRDGNVHYGNEEQERQAHPNSPIIR